MSVFSLSACTEISLDLGAVCVWTYSNVYTVIGEDEGSIGRSELGGRHPDCSLG
jgi:hypothetical protein